MAVSMIIVLMITMGKELISINNIVYEMLSKLRGGKEQNYFTDVSNRHLVSLKEDGGITSYCFSVPICDSGNTVVSTEFHDADSNICMSGTNCKITIGEAVTFDGITGRIRIIIPEAGKWYRDERDIVCGNMKISPTLNGIALRKPISCGGSACVDIETDSMPEEIRENSKHFAFMKQRFVPSFTVSPVGVFNCEKTGALILNTRPGNADGQYHLVFTSTDIDGEMCVEFNMHEPKLIQDTTVESARPDENNAYGTVAFVGHSASFGAQQLYLKFNYPTLGDWGKGGIVSVRLYLPVLGGDAAILEALHMDSRFCSFGSVWNRRVKPSGRLLPVVSRNGYCIIDLTDVMVDRVGRLRFSNGLHLRLAGDSAGCCCLATGDSHLYPPILEVRHRPQ